MKHYIKKQQLTFLLIVFISISKISHAASFLNPSFPKINRSGLIIDNKTVERYHSFNNIGVKFTRNTDLTNAISNFEKSLSFDPNNIYIQYNLANTYLLDNQNERALEIYNTLTGNLEINQSLLLLNKAHTYHQMGRYKESVDLLSAIDLFEAAYNASLILKEMGEYKRALDEAKRALTYKNKKSIKAMLYINYARLLYANNDVISAIDYIKKALSISSTSLELKNELAQYYLTAGNNKNAKVWFEQLLAKKALNPYYYDAVIGLAKIDLNENRFVDCIDKTNKVLKRIPDHAEAHLLKAQAQVNINSFDEAEDHFNTAYDLGLQTQAKIGLAVIRFKQQEYQAAKAIYDSLESLEYLELSYDDLLLFSLNEIELENFENAKEFLEIAINLNPNRAEAYGYYGKISYDQFSYLSAQEYYKKAIKYAKDKSKYRVCLANCYAQTGKYRVALHVFNNLINDEPNYAKAYSAKAMCLLMINKPEKALSTVKKAISLDPKEPFNYMNKAYILSTLAMDEMNQEVKSSLLSEAREDVYFAKSLDTSYISIHYNNNLALIYLEEGDLDKAKELFEVTTNMVTRNNIGVYYERVEDQFSASSSYDEALTLNPFYLEPSLNKKRMSSPRKKNQKEWVTYWVFLTNEILESEHHQFSMLSYSPNQRESIIKQVQFYSFKNSVKKVDKVDEVKIKKTSIKPNKSCIGCPTF